MLAEASAGEDGHACARTFTREYDALRIESEAGEQGLGERALDGRSGKSAALRRGAREVPAGGADAVFSQIGKGRFERENRGLLAELRLPQTQSVLSSLAVVAQPDQEWDPFGRV